MNFFSVQRLAIQKICALSRLSHNGRVGFPRADSIFGGIGSSSVPIELLVTSVTCGGLVSGRFSVTEFFFWRFHNSYQCFRWHGVIQNKGKAADLIKHFILGLVRSSSQKCALHRDLFLYFFVVHHSRFVRCEFHEIGQELFQGPWLRRCMFVCLPLRSLVPPAISPPTIRLEMFVDPVW